MNSADFLITYTSKWRKKAIGAFLAGSEIKSSRGLMHLRREDDEMRVAESTCAKAAGWCACNFNGLADPFCYALLNTRQP